MVVNFPAPVGGTPLPADWAPSILFAVLYALLLPLTVYRVIDRRSRTLLLIGTAIFATERVVFFSLRALQAHNASWRVSPDLTAYMQSTLGLGFIGIANDLVNLLRCLLVNTTYGSAMYFQSPSAATKGCLLGPPPEGTPDYPRKRGSIRGGTGLLSLAFIAATVTGTIANANYNKAIDVQHQADSTARLRYASTAIVPVLGIVLVAYALSGLRFSRICRRGVHVIVGITLLMSVVSIYRLVVMRYRTVSLIAPNPLNKNSAKAAFYIFHILPEWIAALILLGYNTRKTFGTGLLGDWRSKDETEKQRRKREAKEAKKALKKKELTANETKVPVAKTDGDEYALEEMQKGGNHMIINSIV